MVKKKVFQVSAFVAVLFSVLLIFSGSALADGLPFVASEHIFDRAAPIANAASLIAQAPATWESALSWIFGALLALAAVFLILWTVAASSASLLADLPGNEKPATEKRPYNRYATGGIKKPVRPLSPAFPAAHAMPGRM